MKIDANSQMRSLTLTAICVVLFVLLGIVVPYHTYSYFLAKQDAAVAAVPHEEL